jgi:uncharacterized protein (TIGR02145 family)
VDKILKEVKSLKSIINTMNGSFLIILIGLSECLLAQSSVKIGTQTWMTENLDVSYFQNGDEIPQAQTDSEWERAGFNQQPAWCYVTVWENDKEIQTAKFKKLYNSFAINDPRGLVPSGWRISSTSDWEKLKDFSDSLNVPLNSFLSTNDWERPLGTNKFGLNIQPSGWRDVGCGGVGTSVTFWCEQDATTVNSDSPRTFTYSVILYEDGKVGIINGSTSWIMGHYVRCVKND